MDLPTPQEVEAARQDYCELYSTCMFVPPGPPYNMTLDECLMLEELEDEEESNFPQCARTVTELRECLTIEGCMAIYQYWRVVMPRPCFEESQEDVQCKDQ